MAARSVVRFTLFFERLHSVASNREFEYTPRAAGSLLMNLAACGFFCAPLPDKPDSGALSAKKNRGALLNEKGPAAKS